MLGLVIAIIYISTSKHPEPRYFNAMPVVIPDCYHDLVKHASKYRNVLKSNKVNLIEQLDFNGHELFFLNPVFFIIDYNRGKYLYLDPLCKSEIGYDPVFLSEAGLDYYTGLWHKDDLVVFNEKIFPEVISFLQQQEPVNYTNFSFSYNYRIRTRTGSYMSILQRSIFFAAINEPKLVASTGFFLNISSLKADNKMIHTIEKVDKNFCIISRVPLLKSVYFPGSNNQVLSKRELQIVRAIYDGLSSKEIASKYSISINTVNNHRKNMLHKTGTYNSNELLRYAINHGLLSKDPACKDE
jgi:DNA-binding CsgD family transcriptional regulator